MTNSIREIRQAACILITGSNTAESHPVISYEVIRAVKRGANLILIDPRRVPLARHATHYLQAQPGTNIYVFLAMTHVILRDGLADTEFLAQRVDGFEDFRSCVAEHTPEAAALVSGVPAEQIEAAAHLYANGERAFVDSAFGEARGHSTILYAMGITQRSIGTQLVQMLANLAMLTGQVGKPSTGVDRRSCHTKGHCQQGSSPRSL